MSSDPIQDALERRLGDLPRAKDLAAAYRAGVVSWAVDRTTGGGSVPTTLVGERVDLLLAVSLELKGMLLDREIAALLRVTMGTAKRLGSELRAVYEDVIQPFVYDYALADAKKLEAGEYDGVHGYRVSFETPEKLDAFLTEARRTGLKASRKRGEPDLPWLLYVDGTFDFAAYGL